MDCVKGDNSGKFTASLGLNQSMKQRGARTRKGLGRSVHFWPLTVSKNALGGTAGLYAASFVTRECLGSPVCDPTILISCQS
jgi:hypothetical protein